MKKMLSAALLSTFIAAPAFAFEFDSSNLSVGGSYGLGNNGVISVRGDYDISDDTDQPLKIRLGYDRYTIDLGGVFVDNYSWTYNIYYAGAYYDFGEMLNLDDNIHPFIGLGLGFRSATCSGIFCSGRSNPSTSRLYYVSGIQYDVNDQISAEVSFSVWGGLSIGANYNF